jgi:hypothetical protein
MNRSLWESGCSRVVVVRRDGGSLMLWFPSMTGT